MKTCFLLIIAMALSICTILSSKSFCYFCKLYVFIVIGIFISIQFIVFLFSSRSRRVARRSSSGISLVPGGWPGSSLFQFFASSTFLASSLNFSMYLGTFPQFLYSGTCYSAFFGLARGGSFGGRLGFYAFDVFISMILASSYFSLAILTISSFESKLTFLTAFFGNSPRDFLTLIAFSISSNQSKFFYPLRCSFLFCLFRPSSNAAVRPPPVQGLAPVMAEFALAKEDCLLNGFFARSPPITPPPAWSKR